MQESYDNSGLLTGNPDSEITKILVSLDVTEKVVEEAASSGCNLIISHHPIIFKGLKKLTGSSYVERTVIKAIQNDIALYAIHTNLDNVNFGVNRKLGELLGLKNLEILAPVSNSLMKLATYIPVNYTDKVMSAVFKAGAGNIGNYSECSFRILGTGTFKPNNEASPAIGEANKLEFVEENRVEVIFPSYLQREIINALKAAHPYEEPAFDLIPITNSNSTTGAGMVGVLDEPMEEIAFLKKVKETLGTGTIKYTQLNGRSIKRVAVCGGSGTFLIKNAIRSKADIYITSDIKYHEFFDAENQIILADVGHYESEAHTKELIYELLIQKFTNIAVVLAKTVTNPIQYL